MILRWRLHFEFVTAREPMEPPTVLQNQSEVTVWSGAEHVDVDTFSWDLPIKVLPTNPALASYMSHFTGTNSINIWLVRVIIRSYCGGSEGVDWCLCVPVCLCVNVGERDNLFSLQMRNGWTFQDKEHILLFPLYTQSQWWIPCVKYAAYVLPFSHAFSSAS